jgi:hypothetical protein
MIAAIAGGHLAVQRTTPDAISVLAGHEIFVFGSNLAGLHAGGAARVAHARFGAEWGVGEGLTGRSYAFPTLGADMRKVTTDALAGSVRRLWACAEAHPDKVFLLTKVGCGIAGFDEATMAALFAGGPANIVKPAGW